jgi:hypothetical protein
MINPVKAGLPKGLRKMKDAKKGKNRKQRKKRKKGPERKKRKKRKEKKDRKEKKKGKMGKMGKKGRHLLNNESRMIDGGGGTDGPSALDHRHHHRRAAQTTGIVKNLVIPLKWRDHTRRTLPSREDIDVLMNHKGPEARCPTGSVRDVFLENSYEQLELISTVVDWIVVPKSEAFYADKVSG